MHTCARVLLPAVCAILFISGRASATPINLFIDPSFGSTENTGSTAKVTLDFSEDMGDDLLTITIMNTTPDGVGGSCLSALGLELPSTLSLSPAFADGGEGAYLDTLTFDESVSPGSLDAPGGYDIMLTSDGNYEGGSAQGAIAAGASETVILNLGDTGHTPAELMTIFGDFYNSATDHIAVARFQKVGPNEEDSDKVAGGVPEPGSLALLLMGGLGLLTRRRA